MDSDVWDAVGDENKRITGDLIDGQTGTGKDIVREGA